MNKLMIFKAYCRTDIVINFDSFNNVFSSIKFVYTTILYLI